MTLPLKTVEAAQLIYTSVDRARSARNEDGWQVLFHTQGKFSVQAQLIKADVDEIADRVNFFQPTRGFKHLFFRLVSDKVVLARSVPVADRDKGRSGVYLAHALVFTAEDFERLDNNPFSVLSNFRFMKTQEEAFQTGRRETGHLPATAVEISSRTESDEDNSHSSLPDKELHRLLFLACQAWARFERKEAIAFLGPPGKMIELLRNLFPLIPPPLRVHCSFDTLYDSGRPCPAYWAVGFSPEDPEAERGFLRFDLEHQSFRSAPPLKPNGYFQEWLQGQEGKPLAEWSKDITGAYWLGEWLAERSLPESAVEVLSTPLFDEFIKIHRPTICNRLSQKLVSEVGEVLGTDEDLLKKASAWLDSQREHLLLEIEQPLPLEKLMAWMLVPFETGGQAEPDPDEIKELGTFLQRRERDAKRKETLHEAWRKLAILYYRWKRDWARMANTLRKRGPKLLEWFIDRVTKPLLGSFEPGEGHKPALEAVRELGEFLVSIEEEAMAHENLLVVWKQLKILFCRWQGNERMEEMQKVLGDCQPDLLEWYVNRVLAPLVESVETPRLTDPWRALEFRQQIRLTDDAESARLLRAVFEWPGSESAPEDLLERWRWLTQLLDKLIKQRAQPTTTNQA